ncbi:hypothetical protein E9529_11515 [Blastococcus sp. KM273128]|uniref:hypothetical protein n=1 Tax=Blastococcus sp. KM273128 TaxID=2570314 RepID=UPI001F3F12D7|nr:hypothetical protein [Blastococcus sp. KM273128]MCF6744898.1 hypothetical protein [Blastococcus sp. KM273128]
MTAVPAQRGRSRNVTVTGDALEIRHLRVTHREVVAIAQRELATHGPASLEETVTRAVAVGLMAGELQRGAEVDAVIQRALSGFEDALATRATATVAQLDELTARLADTEQATRQAAAAALADLPARLSAALGGEAGNVQEAVRQAAGVVQTEALSQLARIVSSHTEQVRSTLSTDNPLSPLSAAKREINASVDGARRELAEGIAALRGMIQAQQAGQAASRRNPNAAGAAWETVIADHLASFAAATGDVVSHVGSTPAPGSSSRKAGDLVLSVLGSGAQPTIAVECKNRTRPLSVREAQQALSDARRVRRATVGLLVVPDETHVPGPSRFCRVGAVDFVVAADDPTAFTLVLSVLRELSLVIAAGQQPGASVDVGQAQTAVGHALELLPRWDELTRHISSGEKSLASIRTSAETLRRVLTGHLQEAARALRPGSHAG